MIVAVEGQQHAPQEAAQNDATAALVGREIVRVSLRVVEFLLSRLHVHVGVSQLTEDRLQDA